MSQIEYNFALKLYDFYSKYLGTYKINTIFLYLGISCIDIEYRYLFKEL